MASAYAGSFQGDLCCLFRPEVLNVWPLASVYLAWAIHPLYGSLSVTFFPMNGGWNILSSSIPLPLCMFPTSLSHYPPYISITLGLRFVTGINQTTKASNLICLTRRSCGAKYHKSWLRYPNLNILSEQDTQCTKENKWQWGSPEKGQHRERKENMNNLMQQHGLVLLGGWWAQVILGYVHTNVCPCVQGVCGLLFGV